MIRVLQVKSGDFFVLIFKLGIRSEIHSQRQNSATKGGSDAPKRRIPTDVKQGEETTLSLIASRSSWVMGRASRG